MRFVGLLVVVWLIVGAIAAYQRGYFTHAAQNCASAGHDRGDRCSPDHSITWVSIPR